MTRKELEHRALTMFAAYHQLMNPSGDIQSAIATSLGDEIMGVISQATFDSDLLDAIERIVIWDQEELFHNEGYEESLEKTLNYAERFLHITQ